MTGALGISSLTMSYFHTGTRTIIGAESFHCPVRDGKEWYQLAMVIRLNWSPPGCGGRCPLTALVTTRRGIRRVG